MRSKTSFQNFKGGADIAPVQVTLSCNCTMLHSTLPFSTMWHVTLNRTVQHREASKITTENFNLDLVLSFIAESPQEIFKLETCFSLQPHQARTTRDDQQAAEQIVRNFQLKGLQFYQHYLHRSVNRSPVPGPARRTNFLKHILNNSTH